MPTPAAPAPTTSLPPEASTAPDPAPTETAPTLPPEARSGDAVGAEAFIRYWFEVSNYAYRTGDTSAIGAISDATCATCANVVENLDRTYDAGGSVEGGQVHVHGVSALDPGPDGRVVTRTSFEQSAVLDRSSDGSTVKPEVPATGMLYPQVTVVWGGQEWNMVEIAP
ncbi:DUF6318 family protein [Pseudokineococcus sp. 1T1Z-3]|uniref:DUF6318 family protein n=1 Tax=Pseudokineococcus sp. 1T1Z-3 TaxID=3132745 RepID=UPI00403F3AF0